MPKMKEDQVACANFLTAYKKMSPDNQKIAASVVLTGILDFGSHSTRDAVELAKMLSQAVHDFKDSHFRKEVITNALH